MLRDHVALFRCLERVWRVELRDLQIGNLLCAPCTVYPLKNLARRDGFEPPTCGFGGRRSANWNYLRVNDTSTVAHPERNLSTLPATSCHEEGYLFCSPSPYHYSIMTQLDVVSSVLFIQIVFSNLRTVYAFVLHEAIFVKLQTLHVLLLLYLFPDHQPLQQRILY